MHTIGRLAIIAATLALAATADAFIATPPRAGDLDGDGVRERAEAVRIDFKGVDDAFDRTAIDVLSVCRDRQRRRRVAGPQDNVSFLRLRRLDTRRGLEILTELRSGASGRQGEARVVAWRKRHRAACAGPRNLFRYRSTRPTRRPRGTTGEVAFFKFAAKQLSRRRRGVELRLREWFLRAGDPPCCGSVRKTTDWRYSRARDRYVIYRTRVRR